MSRRVIAIAAIAAVRVASAAPATSAPESPPNDTDRPPDEAPNADIGTQVLGAGIGIAAGGRDTPGGARITGHWLYQLSDDDWFDGAASFTFGGGGASCFRDRSNQMVCTHGALDGRAAELVAGVRRFFPANGMFRPYARAAIGLGLVRYSDDALTGLAIPLHAAGGLRADVADEVAVVLEADLALGFAVFGHGLGVEPQIGLGIIAGAEFRVQ